MKAIMSMDRRGRYQSPDSLDFVTYCIGNLSRRLNMSAAEVYRRLKQSGILTGYIVSSYDVLHTFGKEYLMEDLTEYMREKGVLAEWKYVTHQPWSWNHRTQRIAELSSISVLDSMSPSCRIRQ